MIAFRHLIVALGCVLLLAPAALAQSALPYARSYLITGDYTVGGVDISGGSVNGFVTGTIPVSGVPADADILAAFLYWETITTTADPSMAAGVRFRGVDIDIDDGSTVKKSSSPLAGQTASCWSSGSPLTMTMFRADVLRLLPPRADANGEATGRRIVNSADLAAHGLPPHHVRLPKFGTGNQVPESAGATLLVIYRNPQPHSPQTPNPLRKVVVYDGLHIDTPGAAITQLLQGFYQSAAVKSARLTHIAASGQKNSTERLFFNGALVATNPFPDSANAASDRAWANPTFTVSALMPGAGSVSFGETATTVVSHQKDSPYECLTWGAIVFSTAVADVDGDGIPDGLEDAPGGLLEPNGAPLPNLNAMGASSLRKDLFVEINAMWAPPGTTYGSPDAPLSPTFDQIADPHGHVHMPPPAVLTMVGDALKEAPLLNPDGSTGITAHFDVGNLQDYYCLTGDCQSTEAIGYLVASELARGGELIQEPVCVAGSSVPCQFPDYPGTVAWKSGLQWHRDAPVGPNGEQLSAGDLAAWAAGGVHRRRFDPVRRDLFHYVLYAHARGRPRSFDPCIDAEGTPTAFSSGDTCAVAPNPLFHVPTSASGKADLPGADVLITLGFWDNFVGSPFMQASTTLHELGHNMDLGHSGVPISWGNAALGTVTAVDPTCKPHHLSIMSYLFQAHGLLDDDGNVHLDYSRDASGSIDETFLADGSLVTPLRYRAAWFAPLVPGSLGFALGVPAATRFCSGAALPNPLPAGWVDMGRLDAPSVSAPIDWNADGDTADVAFVQDVNFDGSLSGALATPPGPPLQGADDWAMLRMNQTGGGQEAGGFSAGGIWLDDLGGGIWLDDLGGGIWLDDLGGGIWLDDLGGGIWLDDLGGGIWLDDLGSGIFLDDVGGGIWLDDLGGGKELDVETVQSWGNTPPTALRACVLGRNCPGVQPAPFAPDYHRIETRWNTPNVFGGAVSQYQVYRATGATTTPATSFTQVGAPPANRLVDEELPDGVAFTYFVKALSADGILSGPSNLRSITAVNDPPVAVADAYSTTVNVRVTVNAANGVLANDTDVDTPRASLRARLVSGPSSGALVLNADGSFTFTPATGFSGLVTFVYVAHNGVWSLDPSVPMSADSAPATVTIQVNARRN